MASGITVDLSRFPIVNVRFGTSWSDADFDRYLETMEREALARCEPNVTILDARGAMNTPAIQRRKQAEWLRRHEATLKQHSLGTAFVIDSALVRGVLTAILWMQPMPAAHIVVATIEEAERWAAEQLARRKSAAGGVPPPSPG